MAYFFSEPSRTFSEYLLVPGYSSAECIPANVSLKTPVVKYRRGEEPALTMNVPMVSAVMQAVAVEQLGVLAHDVVHIEFCLGGVLDGGIGFERNMEVVAYPAGIDNGISGSDFGDGAFDVFVHENQILMRVGQK